MQAEYDPDQSPYSFGTTPIYNSLYKKLSDTRDRTDMVLLNVSVIMRNISGLPGIVEKYKQTKVHYYPMSRLADDLIKKTTQELTMLVEDVVQMYNLKDYALPRYIILYLTDYTKIIPPEYLRVLPPSQQHIAMADELIKQYNAPACREYESHGVKVVEWYDYSKVFFPNLFRDWLKKVKNNHNIVQVTNHPLDYHIQSLVSDWTLVKSYTGELLPKKQLGPYVFDSDYLPFTKGLHVLLGDKHDLKPAITPKFKKDLLSIAQKDSWHLKSSDYIDRMLAQLKFIPPYVI